MDIKSWDIEDRPREKFLAYGSATLSKAELLAILVGSGLPGTNVVDLMREILADNNDCLHEVERMSVAQLCQYDGIGPAKAVTILAACAIANRYAGETLVARKLMDNAPDIAEYFSPRIANLAHEECHVMLLNSRLQFIGCQLISKGGLASTSVDVRQVMKEAVLHDASAIVLCHNHPSGSLTPSTADDNLTQRVANAAYALNIRMLDHIIVSTDGYYSYQENGKI